MSAASSYLEQKISEWLRGTTFPAAPGTLYLGLFVADPQDDGSGTEVSGGSYARQTLTLQDDGTVVGTGTTSSNNGAVTFPTATAAWGLVTHFGVFDAVSGGNLLIHGAWAVSKNINASDTFVVGDGELSLLTR